MRKWSEVLDKKVITSFVFLSLCAFLLSFLGNRNEESYTRVCNHSTRPISKASLIFGLGAGQREEPVIIGRESVGKTYTGKISGVNIDGDIYEIVENELKVYELKGGNGYLHVFLTKLSHNKGDKYYASLVIQDDGVEIENKGKIVNTENSLRIFNISSILVSELSYSVDIDGDDLPDRDTIIRDLRDGISPTYPVKGKIKKFFIRGKDYKIEDSVVNYFKLEGKSSMYIFSGKLKSDGNADKYYTYVLIQDDSNK
ncbi:MAG: hypothetical protein K1X86_00015 [Ignavibacteria bacterium]|nr:hypothetical protein [Ignavibacteria bacterium]